MFIREEGLATLELVQMVGMGTDTSGQEFDIHRIALPGNFLDPQVDMSKFYFFSLLIHFFHRFW